MEARFEHIAKSSTCAFCTGLQQSPSIDIDAAYCISLLEQPHRMEHASAHFHEIGLCQIVIFYRPLRPSIKGVNAVWESHRSVARKALSEGQSRVLIMEDDVVFRAPLSAWASRVNRALKKLPEGWLGLFLGHLPIQSYFVRYGLLRARSATLHAYIANLPLLRWYDETDPYSAEVPVWRPLARGLDSATSSLPGMYAIFPMNAFQKDFSDGRIDHRHDAAHRRRAWNDVDRWRYFFLFRAPRLLEMLAVALSPLHWLTMDHALRNIEKQVRPAKDIRASGLFDDAFYLKAYPDVAAAAIDPLMHYLEFGAGEGRWPNASFDPDYYATQVRGLKAGENALLHYIRLGRDRGLRVRDGLGTVWQDAETIRVSGLFDPQYYLRTYQDVAGANADPLMHYIRHGASEGRWPNASFDPVHYAKDAVDLSPGQNPLLHYLGVRRVRGD